MSNRILGGPLKQKAMSSFSGSGGECCSDDETNAGSSLTIVLIVVSMIIAVFFTVMCIICTIMIILKCCFPSSKKSQRRGSRKEDAESGNQYQKQARSTPGTLLLPRHDSSSRPGINMSNISTRRIKAKKMSRKDLLALSPKHRLQILEFPHSNICLLDEILETSFGKVYKGEASRLLENDPSTSVLVKSLRERAKSSLRQAFSIEMVWASGFDHPNVLKLLAVSTKEKPRYMIYEYLEFGSLRTFLQSTASLWLDIDLESTHDGLADIDNNTTISSHAHQLVGLEELLAISLQIADGMNYITSKGIIHRDLAARNCQVGEGLKVKIANFGLSYDLTSADYCRIDTQESHPVPLRWLAPESLHSGQYSMYSDIWSYGVVLWEIFSLGDRPYSNLSNAQTAESILRHHTLSRPEYCPRNIFTIMQTCWEVEPEKRIGFLELKERLNETINAFDIENVSHRFSVLMPSTPETLKRL